MVLHAKLKLRYIRESSHPRFYCLFMLLVICVGGAQAQTGASELNTLKGGYEFSVQRDLTDGEHDKALDFYDKALQAVARGQFEQSRKLLQQSLALDAKNASAMRLLVVLLIDRQQLVESRQLLEQLIGQQGVDLDSVKLMARLMLAEGKHEKVLDWLERNKPFVKPDKQWRALQAIAMLKSGQYQGAVSIYQQLRQDYPQQGHWWLGLASAYEGLQQPAKALQVYKQAVAQQIEAGEIQQYMQRKISQLAREAE